MIPWSEAAAPRATYRLQVGPALTLDAVAELAPGAARLGISHLYLSPIWPAAEGSEHGYDVVAHDGVRAELGGDAALERLAARARSLGLGLMVDLVPNHVATSSDCALWRALLAEGPEGDAALAFDVDWDEGEGRVLLPILERPPEEAIAAGELAPERREGALVVRTPAGSLPVSAPAAGGLLAEVGGRSGDAPLSELGRRLERADGAADRAAGEVELARLCADPDRAARVDEALRALGRDRGRLVAFLEAQHWRVVPWRDRRRNVRRFFQVDSLAALLSDRADVFVATHGAVARWVEEDLVQALRVDHVDGLRDPEVYLERLRAIAPRAWIVVEKILAEGEELPVEWPVDGTTGYELARRATAVLVDPRGFERLREIFAELAGDPRPWAEVAREARADTLEELLGADLDRCARALGRAAREVGCGIAAGELRAALAALLSELDLYRTYLRPASGPPRPEDRRRLEAARDRALARAPELGPALAVLLDRLCEARPGGASAALVDRFQTLAPALSAKAVEDTALYRHHPLAALCEVGAEPGGEGLGLEAFHAALAREAARPTAGLFALSTHDTKRSADVRARLCVLSETPEEWRAALGRWSRLSEPHRSGGLPDRRVEHLLWQTLVGAWPLDLQRALAHAEKAAREARLHTSWLAPDERYERALAGFVRGVLGDDRIRADLEAFVARIEDAGRRNALAQVAIAATACGVPDLYAGDEVESLALVDPDNRRPFDFARRDRLARELERARPEEAWERRREGAAKLFLWMRALRVRGERPSAFAPGSPYTPLAAEGAHAERVVAFARGQASARVVVVAPRLTLGLADGWDDTALALPAGGWRDALSGEPAVLSGRVALERLLARFPVALLAHEGGP